MAERQGALYGNTPDLQQKVSEDNNHYAYVARHVMALVLTIIIIPAFQAVTKVVLQFCCNLVVWDHLVRQNIAIFDLLIEVAVPDLIQVLDIVIKMKHTR